MGLELFGERQTGFECSARRQVQTLCEGSKIPIKNVNENKVQAVEPC